MIKIQDETDKRAGLRENGAITNPSATSAPWKEAWIYQYMGQLGYCVSEP